VEFEGRCCKRSIDAVLVEIGAIRSSCDPSAVLVLKSVLEVVLGCA
jgi:hypothetical protein